MENKENLSELSKLELVDKFNHEFNDRFKEENYSVNDWKKMLQIYNNFNNNIFSSSSPVDLYNNSLSYLSKIDFIDTTDLRSLSREDLKKRFNFEFEKKYYAINYTEENWKKIIEIREYFNNNILNSILPAELYDNTLINLSNIKLKSKEIRKDVTLYDLTSEELKIKLNEEFDEKYRQFHYTDENWEKILEIYNNFNDNILQTGFPLRLYSDTRYNLSQVESRVKQEPLLGEKIVSKLGDIASSIAKVTKKTYNTIKFSLRILVLNLAAVIITLFIHLILGTFIYSILPRFVNDFMLQSIISALLFISFNVMLFLDQDDKDVLNEPKINIIKHLLTVPFYCLIFLIFLQLKELPILEELFPIFYPQMWISAFTEEYVFSPMVALSINCVISVLIYLIIRKKTEF